MSDEGPKHLVMTPLAQLLNRAMEENGWDLGDVTRPPDGTRAGGPARSTMSWHLQPERWLKTNLRPKTLKELAVAVELDEDLVADAAWASLERNKDRREPDRVHLFRVAEDDDLYVELRFIRSGNGGITEADVYRGVQALGSFADRIDSAIRGMYDYGLAARSATPEYRARLASEAERDRMLGVDAPPGDEPA